MDPNGNILYRYLQIKFGLLGVSELDNILDSGYKEHQPSITREVKEVKDFALKLKEAFPNRSFEVLDEIQNKDRAVFRYIWNGIHSGQFFDWKPTNKRIYTHGIIIAKILNNKITETWEEWDFAGFAEQLGPK